MFKNKSVLFVLVIQLYRGFPSRLTCMPSTLPSVKPPPQFSPQFSKDHVHVWAWVFDDLVKLNHDGVYLGVPRAV